MFSEAERRKLLRFEVICYIPGNSLNLAVMVVMHSTFVGNNALL